MECSKFTETTPLLVIPSKPPFRTIPWSLEEKERRLIEFLKVRENDGLVQLPISLQKSYAASFNRQEKMFAVNLLTTGDPINTS